MKQKLLAIATLAFALAMAMALTACAGSGTLGDAIDEETGAITVTAKDAGKDSAVGASGGLVIGENQLLVISPNMQKGNLQVKLTNAAGTSPIDVEVGGTVLSTYQVEPGEYAFMITCKTNGATGTCVIVAVDAQEFAQQDAELNDKLAKLGVNLK